MNTKKILCILLVLSLLSTVLAACGGSGTTESPKGTQSPSNNNSEQLESTTTPTEIITIENYTIENYTIAPTLNVTDVYFTAKNSDGHYVKVDPAEEKPTGVLIRLMCPQCHDETFVIVELSSFPQNLIGQQVFTWTDEYDCDNWFNHSDHFDSTYKYSVIFTLNQ